MKLRQALLVMLLGSGVSSCYSFIGRYPGDPGFTEIKALREGHYDDYLLALSQGDSAPPAATEIATDEQLRFLNHAGKPQAHRNGLGGDLVVRFGVFSDVHIREPGVKLFDDRESATLDHVIESFERDPVEEAFQAGVYTATLRTFDSLKGTGREPRFLVNLGDVTDAGTIAELYEFMWISRTSEYPLLSAVGNHDDSIFGNYKKRLGYTKNAGPEFYPVGNLQTFLFMHRPQPRQISDLSWQLLPIPDNPRLRFKGDLMMPDLGKMTSCNAGHSDQAAVADQPPSVPLCLGFDLYDPTPKSTTNTPCDTYPGYYAYSTKGCDGSSIQVVILDSTRKDQWGAWGYMSPAQVKWFEERLAEPADLTLVFLHHRPGEQTLFFTHSMPGLLDALRHRPRNRPLVVFSGHVHSYTTEWHNDGDYWELNLGSLEEYPQWASVVEVRRTGSRMYLNARRLRAALGQDSIDGLDERALALEHDRCRAQVAALPTVTGDRQILRESARCGYIGALSDHRVMQKRWEKPQSQEEAAMQANVVLDISPDR